MLSYMSFMHLTATWVPLSSHRHLNTSEKVPSPSFSTSSYAASHQKDCQRQTPASSVANCLSNTTPERGACAMGGTQRGAPEQYWDLFRSTCLSSHSTPRHGQ